jgi:hypothetical protein
MGGDITRVRSRAVGKGTSPSACLSLLNSVDRCLSTRRYRNRIRVLASRRHIRNGNRIEPQYPTSPVQGRILLLELVVQKIALLR